MMPADALFKRECFVWARNAGQAELRDRLAVLDLADDHVDGAFHGAELERARNRVQRDALQSEYDRRVHRSSDVRNERANPNAPDFDQWCALAKEIRERCDLPQLFDRLGYDLKKVGMNGKRNADEYAGACPLCAGTDRLRVWSGPNGRAWCRQCGWSADAVSAVQSLDRSLSSFYDAVRDLAGDLGLPIPEERTPVDAVAGNVTPIRPKPPAEIVPLPAGFLPVRKKGGARVG